MRHADRRVEVRLADEELGPRHEVAQLEPRDLAAERALELLAEALDHGEAAVGAAEQHLGEETAAGDASASASPSLRAPADSAFFTPIEFIPEKLL